MNGAHHRRAAGPRRRAARRGHGAVGLPHRGHRREDRPPRLPRRGQGRRRGAHPGNARPRRPAQEVHARDRGGVRRVVPRRRWRAWRTGRCRWCSAAITASRPAASRRRRSTRARRGARSACIWVDAHGDMNTPASTHSGNVHGMPLAAVLGPEPAELSRAVPVLADGPAGADDPDRHPQPRRPRTADRPAVGRPRLHDEGHRPPRHGDDRRARARDCVRRRRPAARVVRRGRVRPGGRARAWARRWRAASTTARRTC